MAAFNKYNVFVKDLGLAVHNLNTGTIKAVLTNSAPSATGHEVLADVTQIDQTAGYTTGGEDIQNLYSGTATGTMTATDVVWTSTGSIGPFRYVPIYNDTPTSPADPLIGWWDYGSSISAANGETFTLDFGASVITIA